MTGADALRTRNKMRLILLLFYQVGSDISEGEARVLEDYGWRPNSGLGSMLNYCDRVVHDRSHERDISDWRLRIGKLLMDGYDGGRIVQADLPKRVLDRAAGGRCAGVKLETWPRCQPPPPPPSLGGISWLLSGPRNAVHVVHLVSWM